MKLNRRQMKTVKSALWRAMNWTESSIEAEESVARYSRRYDRTLLRRENRFLQKLVKLDLEIDNALRHREKK